MKRLFVLLSALALLAGAASAAAAPPKPIAGQGYRLVFSDGFRTVDRRVWDRKIWYSDRAARRDELFVRNGVLHLVSRRSRGYPDITTTTLRSRSFHRGYFEARMKWTRGDGAWPAFWLLSTRHAKNPKWPEPAVPGPRGWAAEIDVFEGQGSEPRVFYGTIHRNSAAAYAVPDRQNANNYQRVGVDLTARYHTYACKWTRSSVTWYLDGRRIHSARVYDSTAQPMFMLLQMWTGGWTTGTTAGTPAALKLQVDRVRVWRK